MSQRTGFLPASVRPTGFWSVFRQQPADTISGSASDPFPAGVPGVGGDERLPVLVFFVLVQRRLVSGLGGAVKD
ncbi:hypothetical protein [Streptomyces sp. NPDC057280]|uniref:hypothetical protein n=1 Tax=Streptomyces sp. NPDC057280 TaxID=3346081 RepID=UPI000FE1D247